MAAASSSSSLVSNGRLIVADHHEEETARALLTQLSLAQIRLLSRILINGRLVATDHVEDETARALLMQLSLAQSRLSSRDDTTSRALLTQLSLAHSIVSSRIAINDRLVVADHDEDDTTSRALLKEGGFDPDDLTKVSSTRLSHTPMTWFCGTGNSQMVRYLIARGDDCRQQDRLGGFPMLTAATAGHLEIIKLLCQDGGAPGDIRRLSRDGFSPLSFAIYSGPFDVVYLLILNEALASRDSDVDDGGIDDAIMRRDLCPMDSWVHDKRLPVLAWAQDTVTNHEHLKLFLKGTIGTPSSSTSSSSSSSITLKNFNGNSGVLETIGEYAGNLTDRELRFYRRLIELLSAYIDDTPFVSSNNNNTTRMGMMSIRMRTIRKKMMAIFR